MGLMAGHWLVWGIYIDVVTRTASVSDVSVGGGGASYFSVRWGTVIFNIVTMSLNS